MIHAREDYNRIQDPAGLIPENEPVFLLRAQDATAAQVLRWWAEENFSRGGDPQLIELAMKHADRMDAWTTKKIADL